MALHRIFLNDIFAKEKLGTAFSTECSFDGSTFRVFWKGGIVERNAKIGDYLLIKVYGSAEPDVYPVGIPKDPMSILFWLICVPKERRIISESGAEGMLLSDENAVIDFIWRSNSETWQDCCQVVSIPRPDTTEYDDFVYIREEVPASKSDIKDVLRAFQSRPCPPEIAAKLLQDRFGFTDADLKGVYLGRSGYRYY